MSYPSVIALSLIFYIYFYLYICLAGLGVSCGMWDLSFFFFFFCLGTRTLSCIMCDRIPRPGIEPRPLALGVRSLSCWTIREFPATSLKLWFAAHQLPQLCTSAQWLACGHGTSKKYRVGHQESGEWGFWAELNGVWGWSGPSRISSTPTFPAV